MGTLLSKPRLEKTISSDRNNDLMYGYCAMQGWRIEMEDTHTAILNMKYPFNKWSFFGIFDGHNGDKVAIRCKNQLLSIILKTPEFEFMKFDEYGNPKDIESLQIGIRRGFLAFDEYLRSLPEVFSGSDRSGSTAVCVFITQKFIVFINCGDSRAILIRNSIVYFSTRDHKPFDPMESARIVKAGGSVIADRVNGSLGLSRALGDFTYKKATKLSAVEQMVTADPTISVFERTDLDQMVVICCDGIWDVMNNDEMCDFLLSRSTKVRNLGKIATEVVNLCLYKGSKDNMSALVINLKNYIVIDEEMELEDIVLDKIIVERVREYYELNPDACSSSLNTWMATIDLPNLPPGGLVAKQNVVEEEFERLLALTRPGVPETPTSMRSKYKALEDL